MRNVEDGTKQQMHEIKNITKEVTYQDMHILQPMMQVQQRLESYFQNKYGFSNLQCCYHPRQDVFYLLAS